MRIGIFLVAAGFPGTSPGEVLSGTVDAVVAAEEAGFDDAWIAEHHFMSYGVCPSAATLAAYALGRTSRIGVGTAVSVLSAQHPVALAEQAAMLHHLSGGRFTLGVGRGGPWVELEVFGTGVDRFERGFPESLDLLCAALSGGRVSGEGEFFRFREVEVVPPARLRPVVACTSEQTVRLAAGRGLPMLLGMHIGDLEKRRLADLYGPGNPGHVAAGVGFVADSTARAVREFTEAAPRWLEPGLAGYVAIDGKPRAQRDARKYADFLAGVHPVGSAELCAERILRTAEVSGIDRLILLVEGGGQERTIDNIRRLGAEVLPKVRARRDGTPGPVEG
ncbi:LLM class flavin-dependent oxidoreductase [Nonomuraea sp. NBC_01738]|uniref:LLM class flavin-dependent oxidoreductase n=1 Tax=Nonomuraea sp. NBC_01738 TaxID=2976003 RepID=UPI002E11F4CF|nr:LLM class flavin-dependent oxidoreductase [Nonomuraea sp. NBC_01738]